MFMSRRERLAPLIAIVLLLGAAAPALAQKPPSAPAAALAATGQAEIDKNLKLALDSITEPRVKAHVKFLSADFMEGRGTGERGGEMAAEYVATQFMHAGLRPAVPADANTYSYFQQVPLVGTDTDPNNSTLTFTKDTQTITPTYLDQAVYWSENQQPLSEASSELVFVGYGAVAPEHKWNDFKEVDLTGKILLMLVNDPPSEDPNLFGGKALTYYGRWTYKLWVAAEKGAAGAILIHNTDMAGYGWEVVRNSWGKERDSLPLDPQATPPLRLAGWITEDTAKQIVSMAGQDLAALMQKAATREFQPVRLGINVASRVTSKMRTFMSPNVVGFLPGTDPARNREFVVFTSHYDGLGIGPPVGDDRIYNGSEDNATGVAALIEIARTFGARLVKPKRTTIFIATTAEEQGLRGSEFFTNRKYMFILPGRMAADINVDGLGASGETRDYVFVGGERSPQLTKYIEEGARVLGYEIKPDPHPEKGAFYRSDHFNFSKIGVPSVSIDNGLDYIDKPAGWGEQQYQDYLVKRYHQPGDQFDPTWDFKGLVRSAKIAFYIGYRVAMDDVMPVWNKGDEFEEERSEALAEIPPPAPAKP